MQAAVAADRVHASAGALLLLAIWALSWLLR